MDDERSSKPLDWAKANRAPLEIALLALATAAIGSYIAWCPESPRFDNRPSRREWWKRQSWHARRRLSI